jgi:hypothetical protein
MNLQEQFRQELLEHEVKQLLQEGKISDAVDRIITAFVKFIKKSGNKILELLKIPEKFEVVKQWSRNANKALSDYEAGKLNKKNPNYDKQADKDAWNVIYDAAKIVGFAGFNTLLNFFSFGTGFIAGAAVIFFRKKLPQTIKKYFYLAAEEINKGVENTKDKINEFLTLIEDMSYWGVDDATQDEFTIGR